MALTKNVATKRKKISLEPDNINSLNEDGNEIRRKKVKKKTKKKEKGEIEYFKRSSTKNYIEVLFDELINPDFPKELNKFNLVKKRTYCNKIDLIVDYNNRIFNACPFKDELLMTYLSIKWNIDKKFYKDHEEFKLNKKGNKVSLRDEDGNRIRDEEGNIIYKTIKVTAMDEFLNELYNKLFNPTFVEFIEEYVEENYDLNIDEKNLEKSKKFNPVLQFSDKHCKMLQSISIGMKISIPLIVHFSAMYGLGLCRNTNDYLEKSFDNLFHLFSHNTDLYTKLWESVYSRIVVTRNSDKTFWKYVEIQGDSINEVTSSLYQKLIVDIIPKYTIDQNLINLNHVFINNNIDYTFRNNIEINYKPLNLAEDEDQVSDWDKLSINTARIDEGQIVINEVNIKMTIKQIKKQKKIKISEEEFDYYSDDFVINKLQKSLLSIFFSRYFGSTDTLYYCNRNQYIELIIIMKKILISEGFTILPSVLTGRVQNINEKSTLNKKSLVQIMESVEYNDLINQRYKFTENNVKNSSGLIIKLIANIMNNKFLYRDYEDKEIEGTEIKINNNILLKEEVLRFLEL